ncbi:MAG: threonine transporter RhtB [Rhodobacterales bacterium 34-62-10]|nr:MAG: threonine transporter RhtB [Rhodobacterales bacterium 34-62-10]
MIVDPWVLLAFLPAALALNLTPGADMMFCLGQGLRAGPRAAVAASGGISLGVFVHAGLAGAGLSALIAAMPGALDVIRWVGVAYLMVLAVQALRAGPVGMDAARQVRPRAALRAFGQGLAVNLTNPKVILFVLAFVPQFVDPSRGAVLGQFLVYGAVLSLGGFIINGAVGVFAAGAAGRLTGNAAFARALGWISAGIFTGLALRLALMEKG